MRSKLRWARAWSPSQCEPFEAGRLVVGDPEVGALAGDRGQSIAEVSLPVKGTALIEDQGDFPDGSSGRGQPLITYSALYVRAAKE